MRPSDLNAEMAVIGSALIKPEVLDEADLRPSDFSNPNFQRLWKAMLTLSGKGQPANDIPLILSLTSTMGAIQINEAALLALRNNALSPENAMLYAEKVRECSMRARIIDNCVASSDMAQDRTLSLETVLEEYERRAFSVRPNIMQDCDISTVGDEWLQSLNKPMTSVSWHLKDMDRMTLGLMPNEITTIGARPGTGKTALALHTMLNVAKEGKGVLFFSLDEASYKQFQRFLSMISTVPTSIIKSRSWGEAEKALIMDAFSALQKLPIIIDDSRDLDASAMISKARAHATRMNRVHKTELALVVLDYIQLIGGEARTDNERVTRLMTTARIMSARAHLDCPVMLLSQLNRAVMHEDDKIPKLHHFRDSGSIEAESDVVLGLYRPSTLSTEEPPEVDDLQVYALKNRNGSLGCVNLRLHHSTNRIFNQTTDLW